MTFKYALKQHDVVYFSLHLMKYKAVVISIISCLVSHLPIKPVTFLLGSSNPQKRK